MAQSSMFSRSENERDRMRRIRQAVKKRDAAHELASALVAKRADAAAIVEELFGEHGGDEMIYVFLDHQGYAWDARLEQWFKREAK